MILNIVSHQRNLNWNHIYINLVRMPTFKKKRKKKKTNKQEAAKQESFHAASGNGKVHRHYGGFSKEGK